MKIIINRRNDMRLPYLTGCGQLWLLSSEIAGLFHYLYLWKESVHALDLLHGDNHQGKDGFKSTTFGWVWPIVPLI